MHEDRKDLKAMRKFRVDLTHEQQRIPYVTHASEAKIKQTGPLMAKTSIHIPTAKINKKTIDQ